MPTLVLPLDKGINTREEPSQLEPGWLWNCRGWIYEPDDAAHLWKLPGRTAWGTITPAAAYIRGLEYLQYDYPVNASTDTVRDRIVAWDEDGQLWEAAGSYEAGAAAKALTKSQMAGSDLTFPGQAPKAVHDGANKWIMFTGGRGESRPIVRSVDGVYRPLGLTVPASAPTLEAETTAGSGSSGADDFYSRPSSGEVVTEVGKTADGLWTDFSNAWDLNGGLDYDPNLTTFAVVQCRGAAATGSYRYSIAKWTGFATETPDQVDGYTLKIQLENNFAGATHAGGINVYVSYDAGVNWTLRSILSSPSIVTQIQLDLVGTSSFADLQVKVEVYNSEYLNYNEVKIFDIAAWKPAVSADPPDTDVAITGTFYYAVTEVYSHTDPWGNPVEIESSISPIASITIDSPGTGYKWIKVTMPPLVNTSAYGDFGTGEVTRRLYRSTATGAYPNLGLLAEVGSADDLVFYDTFKEPESLGPAELGTPSIPTIELTSTYFARNDPPPAFLDAVLHRGSLVAIDGSNMTDLVWSIPGEIEYFPSIHRMSLLSSDRNDALRGLGETGPYLLIFTGTKITRLKNLQFATLQTFDLSLIETSVLTHTDGLAGTSKSICYFKSPDGLNLIAWVSDRGIMASDGFLPAERGVGVVNLTQHIDWNTMVDRETLVTSKLTYDPIKQIVWFDFNRPAGVDGVKHRACLALHVSAKHWIDVKVGYKVPKITGPHSQAVTARAIGEGRKMTSVPSGEWDMSRFWAVGTPPTPDGSGETLGEFPLTQAPIQSAPSASDSMLNHWIAKYDGSIFLEYDGWTDEALWTDPGGDIESHLETPWIYPLPAWMIYQGELGHTNWGSAQFCTMIFSTRRDDAGYLQRTVKNGVSLLGARFTKFWLSRSGQSLRLILRHVGKAGGAVGPLKFEIEPQDQV